MCTLLFRTRRRVSLVQMGGILSAIVATQPSCGERDRRRVQVEGCAMGLDTDSKGKTSIYACNYVARDTERQRMQVEDEDSAGDVRPIEVPFEIIAPIYVLPPGPRAQARLFVDAHVCSALTGYSSSGSLRKYYLPTYLRCSSFQ
ncbi:hypothetical protein PLICRDRAFT_520229 [Plicaturopsis crispa FD-325 SS-3]|nr:hypothetical protein PLICRDRAFT_520229 [Plicaturopsis crispa FD-325 SS-3]